MQKDLTNYRKSYEKAELLLENADKNPISQFHNWFQEAEQYGEIEEVNTLTVSSISPDGYPKSRIVLLKQYDAEGFVFYTNYNSEKGKAITANPKVCLSFFWATMERQVIIKGNAEKVAEKTADDYFSSRPRGSRLGALASNQSEVIPSRDYLDNKLKQLENEYEGKEIPRPEHWGGFLVRPVSIEFWQGRKNRLHDRIRYTLISGENWKMERLAP